MRYLRNTDYGYAITTYDLETLLDGDYNLLERAELKARADIELYLRKRYDLLQCFQLYPDYVSGNTYLSGSTVWYNPTITGTTEFLYTTTANTSSLPTSIDWIQLDPRNPLIIEFMVNIALYKVHQRVSPDNVPTHRNDAYKQSMMMLKMIQEGKVSVDLPEIENRVQTISISGSTSKGSYWY